MLLSSSPLPTFRFLPHREIIFPPLASPHTRGSEGKSGDVSVICDVGHSGEVGTRGGGARGKHRSGAGTDCQIIIGHAKFNTTESLILVLQIVPKFLD